MKYLLTSRKLKTIKIFFRESTKEGAPLSEVLETGLARPRFAPDCFNVILKELKLNMQDGWNKHPLLLSIDGINLLFQERTLVSKVKERLGYTTVRHKELLTDCCAPDELGLVVALKHMLR